MHLYIALYVCYYCPPLPLWVQAPDMCNNRTEKQVYYSAWNATTFYGNLLVSGCVHHP